MSASWTEVCREPYRRSGHLQSVTTRLKVPSGWLYRTVQFHHDDYYAQGPIAGIALVFVPHRPGGRSAANKTAQ